MVVEEPKDDDDYNYYDQFDNHHESEPDIEDTIDGISYWYVAYDVHIKKGSKRWDGYQLIRLNTPFFDILKVRMLVVPNAMEEDLVRILFFLEIPKESYKKYRAGDAS